MDPEVRPLSTESRVDVSLRYVTHSLPSLRVPYMVVIPSLTPRHSHPGDTVRCQSRKLEGGSVEGKSSDRFSGTGYPTKDTRRVNACTDGRVELSRGTQTHPLEVKDSYIT